MHKLEIKEISIKESARKSILITLENAAAVYLDFFNNYVTKEKLAEHNGIDTKLCDLILEIGKYALNNQESFNFPNDL